MKFPKLAILGGGCKSSVFLIFANVDDREPSLIGYSY